MARAMGGWENVHKTRFFFAYCQLPIGYCSFSVTTRIIVFTEIFPQTPESMKTVSISMWYFCVALGNLIVIFINKFVAFEKKVGNRFLFPLIYTHKTKIICLVCFETSPTCSSCSISLHF